MILMESSCRVVMEQCSIFQETLLFKRHCHHLHLKTKQSAPYVMDRLDLLM